MSLLRVRRISDILFAWSGSIRSGFHDFHSTTVHDKALPDYSIICCGLIMEYLVNISKRRAFWSLNEDILKINDSDNLTQHPVAWFVCDGALDYGSPCIGVPPGSVGSGWCSRAARRWRRLGGMPYD
ncbi:hypothetical protein Tco_0494691 [Tanacetum coccineum]|uniref:Uncharacterized protein n=1 Tax=Tanacetum coccineum TaxID=301880 RepID=A0ABQ5FN82_9ASTR